MKIERSCGTEPEWEIVGPAGRRAIWSGFHTGPCVLDQRTIEDVAERFLGIGLEEVPSVTARELRPFVSTTAPARSLVMHSATPVLKFLTADLDNALHGRPADDVTTYIETRAVALARPGDLTVGRTAPWRAAAELEGAELISIPGLEYYYLSHAILKLLADRGREAPQLQRLVAALRERPDTVVRLYSLDREMEVVLLCLKRLAGLDVLYTDANSPEIGEYWNTKATLFPTLGEAAGLEVSHLEPAAVLAAESALAPLSQRLGVSFPALPGYVLSGRRLDRELRSAARLLHERYGIRSGCLKPSGGGAGARIVPGLRLDDEAELARLAALANPDEEYILETNVDYVKQEMAGIALLAPSLHIRNGQIADGLTLQMLQGTSWNGNVYLDREDCAGVGLGVDHYEAMAATVRALRAGFERNGLTLATAGIDFALGRVGGAFADRVLVALQDPNLSAHGAEYLRLYLDRVRAAGGPGHGATMVVRPAKDASLERLRAAATSATPERRFEVMAVVPGRWGMIGAAAETPQDALGELIDRKRDLERSGLLLGP